MHPLAPPFLNRGCILCHRIDLGNQVFPTMEDLIQSHICSGTSKALEIKAFAKLQGLTFFLTSDISNSLFDDYVV